MKSLFNIIITTFLLGLCAFAIIPFLNNLFQTIFAYFNTYLDGLFQFIQYFQGLAESQYFMILVVFFVLTVFVGVTIL